MCSRYSLTSAPEAVRALFGHSNDELFPPRYNIAPSQPVLIVRSDHQDRREIVLVRWGLIPSWVKEPGKVGMLINARAETICDKPAFRGGIRHRRCIVPTDGFYEWSGTAGRKRSYLVRRTGGGLLAMAGIWEHWLGADGSEIETMAIVTVASNRNLERIHDRMPALLEPASFATWLDVKNVRDREAARLLVPAPDDHVELLEVSSAINNVRHEGPDAQQIVGRMLI